MDDKYNRQLLRTQRSNRLIELEEGGSAAECSDSDVDEQVEIKQEEVDRRLEMDSKNLGNLRQASAYSLKASMLTRLVGSNIRENMGSGDFHLDEGDYASIRSEQAANTAQVTENHSRIDNASIALTGNHT